MTIKVFFRKVKNAPKAFRLVWYWYLNKVARFAVFPTLFSILGIRNFRSYLWKKTGCNIGKNVYIGWDVYYDVGNANMITIDDNVSITSRCLLLAHRMDMSNYRKGDDVSKLPYIIAPIHICKGARVGMGSIIMPGVTIGEGAIIGAGSVVVKDIPAWTIAVGNPCKVIKVIEERAK
jgi:acetyltransferase-like isoleucine patch superfamily enzyme